MRDLTEDVCMLTAIAVTRTDTYLASLPQTSLYYLSTSYEPIIKTVVGVILCLTSPQINCEPFMSKPEVGRGPEGGGSSNSSHGHVHCRLLINV